MSLFCWCGFRNAADIGPRPAHKPEGGRHHQRADSPMNQPVVHKPSIDVASAAIKKLDPSEQTDQEFLSQVSMVSRFQHENVVALMGYCVDGPLRRKGVTGALGGPVLSWQQRVKIAVGAARGLEYLHEKVSHRGITSSNVLLFDDDVAKIGDFNLPDMASAARFHSNHAMRLGSYFGYIAPEYVTIGESSSKSDVYSFGVVLLELLTGRKGFDHTLPSEQSLLVKWATPKLSKDKVEQCVDPTLLGECPPKDVAKLAAIAAVCVHQVSDFRPDMGNVVKALEPLLKPPRSAH
ncbi:hypothetical protein CARUB_v10011647mg [Capsella rubella]|uniref:Protein kinase domain-containing protein n=1 Tax=Capsella rubella TaxID=81985 RepID=R0IKI4_9BRAS|nr:hypothetical protein CARUB_v10011647mg [Capsella rubella]